MLDFVIIKDIDGIIWDLDGTLLDSFSIFEKVLSEVASEMGYLIPLRKTMQMNFHGSLEETIQRVLDLDSNADLDILVSLFLRKQERHYEGGINRHLFADALLLAQQAAQYSVPQLVLTNREHKDRGSASPRAIVAGTTLAGCIQNVYAGDEVAYRKPDKRSIEPWLSQHNITPDRLLVIGDQFVDVQLAQNVGARSILIERDGPTPHLESIARTKDDTLTVPNLSGIQLIA